MQASASYHGEDGSRGLSPSGIRQSDRSDVRRGQSQSSRAGQPLLELINDLGRFEFDPLGFVHYAYPWGVEGTELAQFDGPDVWQRNFLQEIGDQLSAGGINGAVIREAVRSGHGIGKSALISWLVHWAIATFPHCRGVVTAMTDTQLRTKTWAECGKWHNMSVTRHLFDMQARSYHPKDNEDLARTWRIDCTPWSVHNTSAFAGMHNQRKRILMLFDEAGDIIDKVWEVTEGALTDEKTQIIWCAFGQPTQTTGRFYHCFDAKSPWGKNTIDSRTSAWSNKKLIQSWIDEYGEDSDFVRVRVKGLPPRTGVKSFISPELIEGARRREIHPAAAQMYPLIMGVDPAQFGDNMSVVTLRRGPILVAQHKYSGLDGPDLASRVCDLWRDKYRDLAACCVDAIGIGADVCSSLSRLAGFPLERVNVALPAGDQETYHNLRAQLWDRMRKWLETGQLLDDDELADQLMSVDYGFDGRARFQMQSKDDMRRTGKVSPDRADSFALTFYPESIVRTPLKQAKALPTTRRAVVW